MSPRLLHFLFLNPPAYSSSHNSCHWRLRASTFTIISGTGQCCPLLTPDVHTVMLLPVHSAYNHLAVSVQLCTMFVTQNLHHPFTRTRWAGHYNSSNMKSQVFLSQIYFMQIYITALISSYHCFTKCSEGRQPVLVVGLVLEISCMWAPVHHPRCQDLFSLGGFC